MHSSINILEAPLIFTAPLKQRYTGKNSLVMKLQLKKRLQKTNKTHI